MEQPLFEMMLREQQKQELGRIVECNEKTVRFGLSLTQSQAEELLVCRRNSLRDSGRVEFGSGILPKLIFMFCDSRFISQDNYFETLYELQDIFYQYKNESQDGLTDDELLGFMRRQYEEVCYGDLNYLRDTCLERMARAVRSRPETLGGLQSRLRDEYTLRKAEERDEILSEETRWEDELYRQKLMDLF